MRYDEANLKYLEDLESRLYNALDAVAEKEEEERCLLFKAMRNQNIQNWRVDRVLDPIFQSASLIDEDPGKPEMKPLVPPFGAGLLEECKESVEFLGRNRSRLVPQLQREQEKPPQEERQASDYHGHQSECDEDIVVPRCMLSPTHEEELETTDMEWVRGWAEDIIPDEEAITTAPDAESLWDWEPTPFQELETWDSISAKAVEEERRLIDSWRGQCEALRSPSV